MPCRRGQLALSPSHTLRTALKTFSVMLQPTSAAFPYNSNALSTSPALTNPTSVVEKAFCRCFGDCGRSGINFWCC